jgi:hypothetical protein
MAPGRFRAAENGCSVAFCNTTLHRDGLFRKLTFKGTEEVVARNVGERQGLEVGIDSMSEYICYITDSFHTRAGVKSRNTKKLAAVWHHRRASRIHRNPWARMETRPDRKRRRYSPIAKHSVELLGTRHQLAWKKPFWDGLRVIERNENISVVTLVRRSTPTALVSTFRLLFVFLCCTISKR